MKQSLSCVLLALLPCTLLAQPATSDTLRVDSLRPSRLGQVVVTAERVPELGVTTVQTLTTARIRGADASTVDRVIPYVPAARVQTNSRGEAILYLRNAGERQTAIFLDGALVNVPWDNRVDLSLLPTNVLGGMTISKGVPSVLYGANTLGGAVEMMTRELESPGSLTSLDLAGGENGYYNVAASHLGATDALTYTIALGQTRRDALPLPDLADLRSRPDAPFDRHQVSEERRINTDSRISNAFARGRWRFEEESGIGLSFNLVDGEKGIAPEGHIEGARFWRYPEWRMATVTLNGDARLGADNQWDLRGAIWYSRFAQTIDQFADSTYSALDARQQDDDRTTGARVVLGYTPIEGTTISAAVNFLDATHEQIDSRADSAGPVAGPTMIYQQTTVSGGVELEHRIAEKLRGTVGVGYDVMAMPRTGDKPARDPFSALNLAAGLRLDVEEGLAVRATAGTRSRFPTMRELFGEALRRFLVNPDLKPESAVTFDLGVERSGEGGRIALVGFASIVSNTIDQRNVTDSSGARLRQRINLTGSRTYGAELAGALRVLRPFHLEGHLTWMNTRGRLDADVDGVDSTFELAEKPELVGTVAAAYDTPIGLRPEIEVQISGEARGLNEEDELVPLGSSVVLNARLLWSLPITSITPNTLLQLYLRAHNITDAVVLPQLGLPAPGRELQGGMKLTF